MQLLGVGWERLGIDFNQFSEMFFQVFSPSQDYQRKATIIMITNINQLASDFEADIFTFSHSVEIV